MAAYRYHLGEKYYCLCDAWYATSSAYCQVHGRRLRTRPFKCRGQRREQRLKEVQA